jgi:hypothetical protein
VIYAVNYGEDIVAAVAAMVSSGDALTLTGGHVYNVASELRIGNGNAARHIIHGNGAVVRATAAVRSVLAHYGNSIVLRDLNIEGQRLADHGVYTDTSSGSIYENVDVYGVLSDGWRINHDADRSTWRNCNARVCGRVWHTSGFAGPTPALMKTLVTGTCTVGGGVDQFHRVVTFAGLSVPLTSMGLSRGDWISVDPSAPGRTSSMFWAPIASVDSASQLTLDFHPFFAGYGSPCHFSVHKGDGWRFGPGRADNNIHRIDTCLAENVACTGFYLGGLYGPRVDNIQVNSAGAHPAVIGGYASDRNVFGTSIRGFYTELGLNGASDHIYCDGAVGVSIDTCNAGAEVGISNPSLNRGTIVNNQNLSDPTRMVDPIGQYPVSYMDQGAKSSSVRRLNATIPKGAASVTVSLTGCTASAVIIPMIRLQDNALAAWLESPAIAPAAGSFSIRLTHPAGRDLSVCCYVFSL